MMASVKASRYSANPKGLALIPIQTKDAGGCGARQRQFALHRMPNFCALSRARRRRALFGVLCAPLRAKRASIGEPLGGGRESAAHRARKRKTGTG